MGRRDRIGDHTTPYRSTQRAKTVKLRDADNRAKHDRYGSDRVVGGVALGEDDLVVPSDEEEFDEWAARKGTSVEASQASSPIAFSPTQEAPPSPPFVRHSPIRAVSVQPMSNGKRRRVERSAGSCGSLDPESASVSPSGPYPIEGHQSSNQHMLPLASPIIPDSLQRTPTRPLAPVSSLCISPTPVRKRSVTPDPLQLQSPPSPHQAPACSSPLTEPSQRDPSPPPPQPPPQTNVPDAPPLAPLDPALARFRSDRTFRTRTTLQLQPYTREKLLYEAALRRGGMQAPVLGATTPEPPARRQRRRSPSLTQSPHGHQVTQDSWRHSDDDEVFDIPPSLRQPRQARVTTPDTNRRVKTAPKMRPARARSLTPAETYDYGSESDSSRSSGIISPKSRIARTGARPDNQRQREATPYTAIKAYAHEADSGVSESEDSPNDEPKAPKAAKKMEQALARMLPAAAVKSLERKEAAKRLEQDTRGTAQTKARHNVAIRTRATVADTTREAIDNAITVDDSSDSQALEVKRRNKTAGHRFDQPISPYPARNRDHSSDSQALEVSHADETLLRLRRGDFESIVAGRPTRRRTKTSKKRRKYRQTRLDEESLFAPIRPTMPKPERFSVDFELEHLPSGLVAGQTIMRRCRDLLSFLDEPDSPAVYSCTTAGITFSPAMSVDELIAVLPAYVPDDIGLPFISSYISSLAPYDLTRIQDSIHRLCLCPGSLSIRWWLIDIASRLHRLLPNEANGDLVRSVSIDNLVQLLALGFDKAVKPLRHIIRRESLTGDIDDDLTIAWIATVNLFDRDEWTHAILVPALQTTFADATGPLAAERAWFLAFGLSALSQFDRSGRTHAQYIAKPRWELVKYAASLVTISDDSHVDLRGRDRYIHVMMARCLKLASVWKWPFDTRAFAMITGDLGAIFSKRKHINLPSEPLVDFPHWITHFDIAETSRDDARGVAFDLYLRLVCVAADDIIYRANSIQEAKVAEGHIRRLIMSIVPVTLATPAAAGQLVNRYAMSIVACIFAPDLLDWLLNAYHHWAPFNTANFQTRQISIRGAMYLAVACRHHRRPIRSIVARLADMLGTLSAEAVTSPSIEANRTIVLAIACFRQIILHHSYNRDETPIYPDPVLLHNSWTEQIFHLSVDDHASALEIAATLQAFIDARHQAMPAKSRQRRDQCQESLDYGDLDIQAFLGGASDEEQDAVFAQMLKETIVPNIYRLVSNLLPADNEVINKCLIDALARLWSDCAVILVVDHRIMDWATFLTSHGDRSYARLADGEGRTRVGLALMTALIHVDPRAIPTHIDDIVAFVFSIIMHPTLGTDFLATLVNHAPPVDLLSDIGDIRGSPLGVKLSLLKVLLSNLSCRPRAYSYRCITLLVAGICTTQDEPYIQFAKQALKALQSLEFVNPHAIPGLRHLVAYM